MARCCSIVADRQSRREGAEALRTYYVVTPEYDTETWEGTARDVVWVEAETPGKAKAKAIQAWRSNGAKWVAWLDSHQNPFKGLKVYKDHGQGGKP